MSLQTLIDRIFYRVRHQMDQSTLKGVRIAALLLITLMLVTGCSSTRLAYRYADWGTVWWVEDFITLTKQQKQQKQQLNADIDNLKQWHCSAELPRYQAWLNNLRSELASGKPSPTEINVYQTQLLTFFPPLMQQITPGAINLLSSLSDEQVRELAGNMEDNQREMEDEFLAGNAETIAKTRAERTAERAERWLGSLNGSQQDVINNWSENRTGQTRIWLEGRKTWQKTLLAALDNRNEAGFEETITELVNNPEAGRGEAYAKRMDESMQTMSSLIQDLLQESQPSHLEHLDGRAAELSDDFKALTCKSSSEVASQTY